MNNKALKLQNHINIIKRKEVKMKDGVIYKGDNLNVLKIIPSNSINLVYLDPPFFSGRTYSKGFLEEGNKQEFSDNWKDLKDYLKFIKDRVEELHRVLKKDGALYFHCDWHASHYIKIILDNIFGYDNFRNEISVKRIKKNVHEREKVKKLNVGYDVILFYAKSDKHLINPPMKQDIKPDRWHSFEASEIRRGMDYELFGFKPKKGNHWRWSKERAIKSIKEGILRPNPQTGKPEYLIPASSKSLLDNRWDDITAYSFKFGYPTEKNEKLLDRIITMSSNKGDIILDPFCGCGTTIASAFKKNRRFIGIDLSLSACELMKQRIGKIRIINNNNNLFSKRLQKVMVC
jgi:adenine specific DNA methylase Mod